MHAQETVQRFIELRAQGLSYSQLEEALGVSRPTLIAWSRKHYRDIGNLQGLELEGLAERCKVTRRQRIQQLGDDAQRVRDELAKRDLSEVPTARLITLAILLRGEAARTTGSVMLTSEVKPDEPNPPEFANPEIKWPA